jgi:hypothetical protein
MTTATLTQPIQVTHPTNDPTSMEVLRNLPLAVVKLLNNKGKFVAMVTSRPMKVRKGCQEILKQSEYVCRIGIEYDHQKAVIEKRESGELPAENQGLIGREWIVAPVILRSIKSGKYMVRCSPVHNNPYNKHSVRYIRNGVEISREDAMKDAYASEFADRESVDAFDVTVDNIVSINSELV